MPEWKSRVVDLPHDHGWSAKPGNSIFVANRGAVRFEYPSGWVITPDGDSICLHDAAAPDDNMRLQVSVLRLGPDGSSMDWSAMPSLADMMENTVLADDARRRTREGPMLGASRRNLEYLWLEMDFEDPAGKRKAHSRACLARGGNVQAFITMEYWPEDRRVAAKVWNDMLESLKPLRRVPVRRQPALIGTHGRRGRARLGHVVRRSSCGLPPRRFGGRIETWLISSPGRPFRAAARRRIPHRPRRCRRTRPRLPSASTAGSAAGRGRQCEPLFRFSWVVESVFSWS